MINEEQEPLFESIDEMCEAFGWSDEVKEQIRRDIEETRVNGPNEASSTLH